MNPRTRETALSRVRGVHRKTRAKNAVSARPLRLRGKDSNLDYLVQSQASYH